MSLREAAVAALGASAPSSAGSQGGGEAPDPAEAAMPRII